MILSEGRQSSLAHIIADDFSQSGAAGSLPREEILRAAKGGISLFIQEWEALDMEAQKKIQSLKRGVAPGSTEWDTLYSQYLEEGFSRKSALFSKTR